MWCGIGRGERETSNVHACVGGEREREREESIERSVVGSYRNDNESTLQLRVYL